jgi:hypothetical protein
MESGSEGSMESGSEGSMESGSEGSMESGSEGSMELDSEGSMESRRLDAASFPLCIVVVHEFDASPLNEFDPRLVHVRVGPMRFCVRVVHKRKARTSREPNLTLELETVVVRSIPSGLNFSQVQVHGRRALAHPSLFVNALWLKARKYKETSEVHWQKAGHHVTTGVITNNMHKIGNLTICISHIRFLCKPLCQHDDAPTPEPHKHDSCSAKVFLYWGSKLVISYDVLDFQQAALVGRFLYKSDGVEV